MQEASTTKIISIAKNAGMETNASMTIAHLPTLDKKKNRKTTKDAREHASTETDVGMTIAHLVTKIKPITK